MAIESTKATVLRAGHLCCGMAGIDEILFEIGSRLGDQALVRMAQSRRAAVLLDPSFAAGPVLGLMQGAAGLAYSLLRIGEVTTLPCVLYLGG